MNYDTISRADVIKIIKSVLSPASSLINVARARRQMLNEINELESKPEPHWIPVEQDTPTEDDDYWATFDAETGRFVDWASWYQGRWVTWIEGSPAPLSNVIAWQKSPEPYKGVTE